LVLNLDLDLEHLVRRSVREDGSEAGDLVIVGRIRRSHGVKGVVVVETMTAGAEDVFRVGNELVAATVKGEVTTPLKTLRIEMAEPFQGGFRVQFAEITGKDEADRWRNRYVLAPRETLPEPGDDEVYLHDLVGMSVEGADGQLIGRVEAYYQLPHDIMVEVARENDSVMVPYRFVTEVDLEGKRLVVQPPEGLL
jgi:16S rRNA processing protein RimM